MFCAAMEGSKTSMETSTSMEDAVLTAWTPNAKKNFVTWVGAGVTKVSERVGGMLEACRCELIAGITLEGVEEA